MLYIICNIFEITKKTIGFGKYILSIVTYLKRITTKLKKKGETVSKSFT